MHDLGVSSILSHKIHDYFSCHKDISVIQDLYTIIMDEVERPLLETTLKAVQGNQKKAAAILGINRNTLRKKLLYHNVCFEQYR
jgi:DNA-binding protein Fis